MNGNHQECMLGVDDSYTFTLQHTVYILLRSLHSFHLPDNFLLNASDATFRIVCTDWWILLCELLFRKWWLSNGSFHHVKWLNLMGWSLSVTDVVGLNPRNTNVCVGLQLVLGPSFFIQHQHFLCPFRSLLLLDCQMSAQEYCINCTVYCCFLGKPEHHLSAFHV